jgi:hypothetical protein
MKFFQRLNQIVFPDPQEISEELIQHFEKNPDELDLMINKEYFNSLYLGTIFTIGLGVTVSSRLIQYLYGDTMGDFINNVVFDVVSELGIAIFGGAIVAYLIEFSNKKQFQRNIAFRRKIKAIINDRSEKTHD